MYDLVISTNNGTTKQIASDLAHVAIYLRCARNEPNPGRIVLIMEEVE